MRAEKRGKFVWGELGYHPFLAAGDCVVGDKVGRYLTMDKHSNL